MIWINTGVQAKSRWLAQPSFALGYIKKELV
jgi:hypothetical protein